jgi:PadR family transcriptional regulator AphA
VPKAAELPFAESVCLALLVEGATHGWAVGTLLAPEGEVGRIWTLSRPLTYRAIDGLVEKGLVERRDGAGGRGRDRVILAPTAAGRRVTTKWLERPVEHIRDVRTELLVKLLLRQRAGLEIESLLTAQQELLAPMFDALMSSQASDDFVDVWRRENARAVRRFIDQMLHPREVVDRPRSEMRLSARNQIRSTVTGVRHGDVMSTIKATLGDGQALTAAITKDAAEDLDLVPGDSVLVIVKSTEVMVAKE